MTILHFRAQSAGFSNMPTTEQSTSKPITQGTTNLPDTSGALAQPLRMITTQNPTSGQSQTVSKNSVATTTAQTNLLAMFHSDALAAQTIAAQTWTMALPASEGNGAANAFFDVALYVWRPGTNSKVGTIYDTTAQLGTEFATTLTSKTVTFSGSAVTVQAGDHLVLEVWARGTQSMGTAYSLLVGFNYSSGEGSAYLDSANNLTFQTVQLDLVEVVDDVLQPSEARSRRMALRRLRAESEELPATDIFSRGRLRLLAEAVDSANASARLRSLRRLDYAALNLADARLPALIRLRLYSEVQQQVEASARLRAQLRIRAESAEASETRAPLRSLLRRLAEAVSLGEAYERFRERVFLRTHALELADVPAALRGLRRLQAEAAEIGYELRQRRTMRRARADAVESTEGVSDFRALLRQIGEDLEVGWGVLYELASRIVSLVLSFLNVTPFAINSDGADSASIVLGVRDTDNLPFAGITPAQVQLLIESIAVSASNSEVAATGAIAANGSDVATVTITVRDASNRPIPDVLPTIAVSGTGNSITQPTQRTNQSGVTTATFTTTVAESKTVTATADEVAITDTATVVAS